MHEIITTININAPPHEVWTELIDFEAYRQWNPFIRTIEGSPREGERLKISIQPVGARGMTFRPRVIRAVPARELRWLGRLILPGIFDGEHSFEIEPLNEGQRTRFTQRERFTGVLVPFLRRSLDTSTRKGFEAMNQALKDRVEKRGFEALARGTS
jgi:hypothetical protein